MPDDGSASPPQACARQDSDKAKTMLSKCATSTDHNYSADNGDQLKQAFRDIALKIAFLRLTH